MTDETNKGPEVEIRSESNLLGVLRAVGLALFHAGKLEKEQRLDLIGAGLDLIKTLTVDDLTHGIGIGKVSDEEVVGRLTALGIGIEDVRRARLDRFFTLCELLKPDLDISYRVEGRQAA